MHDCLTAALTEARLSGRFGWHRAPKWSDLHIGLAQWSYKSALLCAALPC